MKTVRLADETWEWLKAEALRRDVSVNSLIVGAVAELQGVRQPGVVGAAIRKAMANGPAIQVAAPVFERKPFNPQPKKGKAK